MKTERGFTLLEVLLSVALIAILTGISVPSFHLLMVSNDLDNTSNNLVQSLRRARGLSRAVDGDVSWGVNINSVNITLFKGSSFVNRDTNSDEIFEMPGNVTPSGIGEVVFEKFSGNPQTTGDIILKTSNNESRNITINPKGMIEY